MSSSTGKLTDASIPIDSKGDEKIKMLPVYLNRLQKLIIKNGYLDRVKFFERREKLQQAFEKIDEFMREYPALAKENRKLRKYARHLYRRKIAYQQLIYFVRVLKFDKNMWKEFFPCLVFGRLTEIQLGETKRWHPPRRTKKRDPKHKTVKTLPYFLAGKKMIEDALNNERFPKVMKQLRTKIPFGSPLFLKDSFNNYNETEQQRRKLEQEKEKLEFCAWCKIGKGERERMAQQPFCRKNQKYIKQFRHPALKQKNLKTEELNKLKMQLIDTSS